MCLQQVTLDVEIWVNKTLQTELTSQGMSYHSLTDYDLQLAEVYAVKNIVTIMCLHIQCLYIMQVCTGSGCVVLVLVVLLEASPMLDTYIALEMCSTYTDY